MYLMQVFHKADTQTLRYGDTLTRPLNLLRAISSTLRPSTRIMHILVINDDGPPS